MGVKITRKLLKDYQKIKREISILEWELNELRTTDKGIGNSVIMDYRDGFPRPQSVVGFDQALYDRRLAALESKKAKCAAVERWINSIEDGQTRCVFRMYYIDGMSWGKISQKIGYRNNADYPRRYIRDKYLEKGGIK